MSHDVNNVTDSNLFQLNPLSNIICILIIIFIIVVGGMMLRSLFRKNKGERTCNTENREAFTRKDEKVVMLVKSIADVYKAVDDYLKM